MFPDDIETRIAALSRDIDTLSSDITNESSRKALLDVIMKGMSKVESPVETIWRIIMSPHAPAALMVLIRMGVLQGLVTAGRPMKASELSESCNGDERVIVRMMRPLVALGIFRETDVQTYESTAISQTLTAPPLLGGYQFMFDCATRSLANLPRYLERNSFSHVDGAPGPFQDINNTSDGMFPYLMKNPEMMSNFNAFMAGSLETRPDWFRSFPVEEIILKDAKTDDPEATLIVDVGGGEGHDIEAFHRAYPKAPGKLVLQDLPPVIENIKILAPAIIRQPSDFFTPQKVRGARGYYFRYILHDWPDDSCVEILKHTASAMEPGYSKILIFEWILPAKHVPLYPSLLDINMMAVLNGMERTEDQWTVLLAKAGLKICKFWKSGEDQEGLIEAQLI
ncbi:S-adenosyl-L-methionine-dependent methyltransferase [Dendryphion nanum]|uniref:S-adenosyl-L-methionine-dependent methyltransferase n=1 Tax=Dendryphion nanum TaxID=256645 RepID=A0A9P9DF78_9PLEO|nr:S-adenosyl-L-methionine-dependent methyltransferase [Dendryphion nanum]